MEKLKTLLLHPFLIAAYPVLALFAANFSQLEPSDCLRALAVVLAAAFLLLALLKLVRLEGRRAAAVISLTAALFFSFGHVFALIPRTSIVGIILGQMDILVAVWAALWILLAWFIIRKLRALDGLTLFLNVAGLVLVGSTLFTILAAGVQAGPSPRPEFPMPAEAAVSGQSSKPDIYYIILDGYPRQDLLKEVFSYDNSELISFLKQRGFYVADQSTSNYAQTAVSLASSLNFELLQSVSQAVGANSSSYLPLRQLIKNNRARRFLEQQGYQFVSFETGYEITEVQDADRYIAFGLPLNSFESLLLNDSLAVISVDSTFAARYRARITGTFDQLGQLAGTQSPKFVFAHIMAAHPPFVFGPNGEVTDEQSYRIEHDTRDVDAAQLRVEMLRGQLVYINRKVQFTVDDILRNSKTPPVIIIQADHGSAAYMDWLSAENTCFHERMSIFNAYYMPGGKTDRLYPSITPVNTFRVVLDTYFGTHLGLLKDENYFSLWLSPYNYIDVTNQLDIPCAVNASRSPEP